MAWLSAQGLGDSSSASGSPLDPPTAPSATWKGKPIAPKSWPRVWQKAISTWRLSGTMSQPSAAETSVALWISSLRASRANHTPLPESNLGTRTSAPSGPISSVLFENVSREPSLSRMSRHSSSTSSRSGEKFESWASDLRRPPSIPRKSVARRISAGDSLSLLPTPTARQCGTNRGGGAGRVGPARPGLGTLMETIPTPTAGGAAGYSTDSGRHSGQTLTDVACGPAMGGRRGKLNPRFSEWLMGLPTGWTSLEPLETESFQQWLHAHSEN